MAFVTQKVQPRCEQVWNGRKCNQVATAVKDELELCCTDCRFRIEFPRFWKPSRKPAKFRLVDE